MRFIIIFTSLLITTAAWASNAATPFIGAWELIAIEQQTEQGNWQATTGDRATTKGIISYSKSGHMQVQFAQQAMPWITLANDGKAHDMNNAAATGQYRAYFGRYSVYPEQGLIHHEREAFLLPNTYPPLAIRQYQFVNDKLILKIPNSSLRLVWRKYPN